MLCVLKVCVKLSMLGYSVPGWHADANKEALLKALVLEVIDMFGASRCMFASNYHVNAQVSDSDGKCGTGPEMIELYDRFEAWIEHMPDEEKARLFAGTAEDFYRI